MQLQTVRIKNFRGIEDWEIELKPSFNLIKGENGKGKTSILEAISVGLGGFTANLDGVQTRAFSKKDVRELCISVGQGSYNKTSIMPAEVSITADLNGEIYNWTRERKSLKSSRGTIQPRDICQKAELMTQDNSCDLPILSYLGAGRIWMKKNEKSETALRKQYFRITGYEDALSESVNIQLLQNWCAKMEQIAWQKETKIAEYEAVKTAVENFMQYMEPNKKYRVFYDKQQEELIYEEGQAALPIRELSAGYQSLIWIVLDIAYRMAVLNPYKEERIVETYGVVLIDELDMHLHPKWQWNIIDALRRVFPNVQFIATTHSPILFASARNVWLIDIENKEIEYEYSHYGIDINTSVNTYQETQEMPAEIKEKADKFFHAMDMENYKDAQKILEELENNTAPAYPLLLEMRTRYELETTFLEE